MDEMEEIRETFFIECEELLEEMESGLLTMKDGEADKETVNAVFRAVHSIKGGAGAFGLDTLVRFAHTFETTLDEIRSDRLEATADVLDVFLRAGDILGDLVRKARDGDDAPHPVAGALIEELTGLTGAAPLPADPGAGADGDDGFGDFTPMTIDLDFGADDDEDPSAPVYTIRFAPKASLYANGNDATLLLRALGELGDVSIVLDASALPSLDALEAEGAYLSWRIDLTTEAGADAIREIFEFVEGECELSIEDATPPDNADDACDAFDLTCDAETYAADTDALPEPGEAETDAPAAAATTAQDVAAPADDAAEEPVTPRSAASARAKETDKDAKAGPKATVRVDLDRVDRLINLIGELVINQAMLSESVFEAGVAANSSVATGLDEFKQLTREVQESVMAIRAQPVKSLFQRMSRIVREAAAATGKSVHLDTEGDSTEVDKTVIERLADPLTHMIRNAVDHGLESPDRRREAGKSETGVVRLSAAHRSGRVVIEVADDGGGINRERVKQIAIDKGLIPAEADLSEGEIDNLLFLPGFSTAKAVSDLSGRGVGMDVVKRAIQALGGRVTISSTPGKGTSFIISLPLTLAVLDGMIVKIADQTLVVPLTSIVETLKPSAGDIQPVCPQSSAMLIRGEFVPIIDVGAALKYRDRLQSFSDKVVLLVETEGASKAALVVDGIHDQRQVVIKGLEDNYGHVPGIAAATILGDGRIALILDADAIIADKGLTRLDETKLKMAG